MVFQCIHVSYRRNPRGFLQLVCRLQEQCREYLQMSRSTGNVTNELWLRSRFFILCRSLIIQLQIDTVGCRFRVYRLATWSVRNIAGEWVSNFDNAWNTPDSNLINWFSLRFRKINKLVLTSKRIKHWLVDNCSVKWYGCDRKNRHFVFFMVTRVVGRVHYSNIYSALTMSLCYSWYLGMWEVCTIIVACT